MDKKNINSGTSVAINSEWAELIQKDVTAVREFARIARGNLPKTEFIQSVRGLDSTSELLKTLRTPLDDLKSLNQGIEGLAKQSRELINTVKGLDANFGIPKKTVIDELAYTIGVDANFSTASKIWKDVIGIRETMQAMKSPWLDQSNLLSSFSAFTEIQGIGQLLKTLPSHDQRLSETLRECLGDWREPIVWRTEIFSNPVLRSEFYKEKGFNTDLTDFPVEAFNEGLDRAGLLINGLDEGEADDTELLDEEGLIRTTNVYNRIVRFEIMVRNFIELKMLEEFGPGWIKQRVPLPMRENWKNKREKDINSGGQKSKRLIDYAEFTDYIDLILQGGCWKPIFEPYFKRDTFVREGFQRLIPIRNSTMHSRLITQEDEIYLLIETRRLIGAIRDHKI